MLKFFLISIHIIIDNFINKKLKDEKKILLLRVFISKPEGFKSIKI